MFCSAYADINSSEVDRVHRLAASYAGEFPIAPPQQQQVSQQVVESSDDDDSRREPESEQPVPESLCVRNDEDMKKIDGLTEKVMSIARSAPDGIEAAGVRDAH